MRDELVEQAVGKAAWNAGKLLLCGLALMVSVGATGYVVGRVESALAGLLVALSLTLVTSITLGLWVALKVMRHSVL